MRGKWSGNEGTLQLSRWIADLLGGSPQDVSLVGSKRPRQRRILSRPADSLLRLVRLRGSGPHRRVDGETGRSFSENGFGKVGRVMERESHPADPTTKSALGGAFLLSLLRKSGGANANERPGKSSGTTPPPRTAGRVANLPARGPSRSASRRSLPT